MSSTCASCGFKTEQLMLACPRCQQPLQHDHCKNCGRCPLPPSENAKPKK